MEITDRDFWEKFWGNIKLPSIIDYNFKNERVIANTIKKYTPAAKEDKTVLEIGCAPGRWLVFFSKELGYLVNGCEYLPIAAEKTIENLKLNNISVEKNHIITADFLKHSISEKYNAVLSLGFIEHFDNYEEIFVKHLDLLDTDGYLILGMPNFKGINYIIQLVVDFYLEKPMLKNHHLKIMNLKVLRKLAEENKLKQIFLNYIGGFEPALFDAKPIKNILLRKMVRVFIKLSTLFFGNLNNPITGSYILGIFKKS